MRVENKKILPFFYTHQTSPTPLRDENTYTLNGIGCLKLKIKKL